MKEIEDAHKTMFIKFPTVTKLIYPFQSTPQKQSFRASSYRSNISTRNNIKSSLISKAESFKIIQLPQKNEIMNICTMTMRHKQKQREDCDGSSEEKFPRKKIFSVTKFNSLKLNRDDSSSSIKKSILLNKYGPISNIKKFNVPLSINLNYAQAYFQVNKLIALSFGAVVPGDVYSKIRKGKVEIGNNGLLVRQVIKKRQWWNVVSEEGKQSQSENINLLWTQSILSKKILQKINQHNEQNIKAVMKYQELKQPFPNNIDKILNQLPKIKQLFFTDWEEPPLRLKDWLFKLTQQSKRIVNTENIIILNHLASNWQITNKKMLYKNMINFYNKKSVNPHQNIPKTYHLTCFNWQEVIKEVRAEDNKWILKPGEFTNRGKGISIFKKTKEAIDHILLNPPKTEQRTYLLQEYITPTLYEERKFDIRCYMLGVEVGSSLKFYWYEEGYIRTASSKFSLSKTSKSIHLTNDAIQKNMKKYGEHQSANKLSYSELQKYFLNNSTFNFYNEILPEMKKITRDICHAVGDEQLIGARAGISFQLFGLDFLIDEQGKPYLIQVNTNPCLDICCTLLSRIIPQLLENTCRLVCDVFLPPKKQPDFAQHFLLNNKYSLIYSKASPCNSQIDFNKY